MINFTNIFAAVVLAAGSSSWLPIAGGALILVGILVMAFIIVDIIKLKGYKKK